jgi:hypothetical protein
MRTREDNSSKMRTREDNSKCTRTPGGGRPIPFGCPSTLTIIRNIFFSPPPLDCRTSSVGGWGGVGGVE